MLNEGVLAACKYPQDDDSNIVGTEICLKTNVLGRSNERLLATFKVVVMLEKPPLDDDG